KLPYNSNFPKAFYPWAKKEDGCSSWTDEASLVRDHWGVADFGKVCDAHDRCYYSIGSDANTCNDDFYSGLKKSCNSMVTEKPWLLPHLPECLSLATVFYGAVKTQQTELHTTAQDLSRNYDAYATKILKQVYFDFTERTNPTPTEIKKYKSILLSGNLQTIEADIVNAFGTETIKVIYKNLTGFQISNNLLSTLMPYLKNSGIYGVKSEIYISHGEEIIKRIFMEEHGTSEIPFYYLMYFKRLLIESKDIVYVRAQIKATVLNI
ncbi:hypothetical protein MEO40_27620, partial [Dolichospermum sp. ST_sed1]|nr:hypothetical protein [Dolichospermum sp. ST_sed1]